MRRHLLPHLDQVLIRQNEFDGELQQQQTKRWVSWALISEPHMNRKRALQFAKFSRVYMECERFDDVVKLQIKVKDYLFKMLETKHQMT